MTMPYHESRQWGRGAGAPSAVAYDSHFFSGQDCYAFLYPYYLDKLIPIPATQFQYGISQQKTPIYGAWSYRWDAVAKGQVIVQGEFSVVFTMPNMIGQMLGDWTDPDFVKTKEDVLLPIYDNAAANNAAELEDLRKKYWGVEDDVYLDGYRKKNETDHQTAFPFGRTTPDGKAEAEYCAHQPFDIIICYGDNPAMHFQKSSEFDYNTWIDMSNEYMKMMSTTQNESGWVASKRIRIQSVELMSAGSVLEVSGQPLQETYSFIARDITTPEHRYVKQVSTKK